MAYPKIVDKIEKILLVAGGLNWALVVFGFNLVQAIENLVKQGWVAELVYLLVGYSAVRFGWQLWKNKGRA